MFGTGDYLKPLLNLNNDVTFLVGSSLNAIVILLAIRIKSSVIREYTRLLVAQSAIEIAVGITIFILKMVIVFQ
ncbi:unnamed protein product [Toxocara canis]|uniref:G_PROTEIN_RECEP_F1_2 domain-containing protein n=1 Tax=Toxocara canis TaxID=6265 RepID=A0A183U180_TOXCA|nr:unnamed protein product [Toxocara canis]